MSRSRSWCARALTRACGAALVLCLGLGSSSAEEAGQETYDPYAGMEVDGSIPKVELPEDLAHPERWQYIPEGKIKPGNFFERFLVSSFLVAFPFRDGDVGTGAGAGVTDIDFRAQRRREFAGLFLSYTTKGQQSLFGLWRRWLHVRDLPGGGVIQEDRSFVGISGGYQKTLTRRFFGFGADSEEDDEIKYTDERFEAELSFEHAVPDPGSALVVGGSVRGEFHALTTDDLGCGDFHPVESCIGSGWDEDLVFQNFIRNSDHEQLGWITANIRWDTRDSQRNPYEGWFAGALVEAALLQDDSDVGARFTFDVSKVIRVPGIFHDGGGAGEDNPPTDVWAFGFVTQLTSGDLPFTAHPTLGGSHTLRGYIDGRFRDDASWHAAMEHRLWVIPRGFPLWPGVRVERVGLAPFFEMGSVGSDGFDLFESEVKTSYGVGLRLLLERGAPFRVDLGWSTEGFNWSARFGYSF